MFDLEALVKTAGYLGLTGIIFAESGLLFGFFLPGDSLLFTAGFLASQGYLDIWLLVPLMFAAATIGDSVGYAFGHKVGPKIFTRRDSILFHQDHLTRSNLFFEKHGGKTIILARFLPVIRTFAPILAGVGKMKYKTFLMYNVVGALIWAVGVTLGGYFLGKAFPQAEEYMVPIVLVIVILTSLPTIIHLLKDESLREQLKKWIKRKLNME